MFLHFYWTLVIFIELLFSFLMLRTISIDNITKLEEDKSYLIREYKYVPVRGVVIKSNKICIYDFDEFIYIISRASCMKYSVPTSKMDCFSKDATKFVVSMRTKDCEEIVRYFNTYDVQYETVKTKFNYEDVHIE